MITLHFAMIFMSDLVSCAAKFIKRDFFLALRNLTSVEISKSSQNNKLGCYRDTHQLQ